ncbi:MAG: rhomboid family intramembrane serine protease [Lachnospiraceae bacterium]|nr:rhomboid family intramembrane serine protease [Lachnospiraceae bacterium]
MKDYLSGFINELINNEYGFLGLADGTDKVIDSTAFGVCVKAVPPVLYVVSVVNTERISPEEFESHAKGFVERIRKNKGKLNCSFTVDVNILAGRHIDRSITEFIDSRVYDPSEKDHSIWWAADKTGRFVISGKNMPDDIAGLRAIAYGAFGKGCEDTVTGMERNAASKKESLKKTRRHTVTYILLTLTAAVFIITRIFGGEQMWAYMFGNDHSRIVLYGEYYRLISCMFIHAGFMHIGYNCISLYVFGTRAEEYLGHTAFLLMYFGAGLCGSIMSFLFTQGLSVGASGAVYGAVGAVFALSLITKKSIGGLSNMAMLIFIITGLGLGALGGNVDNFAHLGGFIFGFLYTYIFLKAVNKTS